MQHHRTITADESGKGIVIAAARESVQQLFVAVAAELLRGELTAKVAKAGC
jgi:hypothetical protein